MQQFIIAGLVTLPLMSLSILATPIAAQEVNRVNYRCDNNKGFKAAYRLVDADRNVELTFGSKVMTLPQVEAASGARYSNGSVTLNTKGNTAFVQVGDKVLFENCVAQSGRVPGLW